MKSIQPTVTATYHAAEMDKLKKRIHELEEKAAIMGDLLVKAHYELGHITPDDGAEVYMEINAFLRGKP